MIHLPTQSRGAQRALVRFFSVACERTNLATFEGELVGASFGPAPRRPYKAYDRQRNINFHAISNEGALITSTVALKNPPRAQ